MRLLKYAVASLLFMLVVGSIATFVNRHGFDAVSWSGWCLVIAMISLSAILLRSGNKNRPENNIEKLFLTLVGFRELIDGGSWGSSRSRQNSETSTPKEGTTDLALWVMFIVTLTASVWFWSWKLAILILIFVSGVKIAFHLFAGSKSQDLKTCPHCRRVVAVSTQVCPRCENQFPVSEVT